MGDYVPRHSLEVLTETMFYVLMALNHGEKCGIDIADWIAHKTKNRCRIGPATLYTILAKFEKESYIHEIEVQGRKRTYAITDIGRQAYLHEVNRLHQCLNDAASEGS